MEEIQNIKKKLINMEGFVLENKSFVPLKAEEHGIYF